MILLPTRFSLPKRHLDRFSRFRRDHERNQQEERETDRAATLLRLFTLLFTVHIRLLLCFTTNG